MKIKRQLTMGVIFFCVIFLLIGASAIYTSWQVQKLGEQQEIANNVVRGAYELSYLSNDYLFHLEKRQNIQWNSRFISLSADIARLDVDKPEQQVLVNNIITNKERLKEIYTGSVASIESAKTTSGGSVDPELIQMAWSRFIVQNQEIIFDASQLSQMLNEEQDQLQFSNTLIIFSSLAVFCIVLFTNYLFINRRILRSLSTLKEGAEIIGSGNLEFTIEEYSKDEIGALSHAFNRMTMNLKAITTSKEELEKEIADRKQAEEALRESEADLNAIILGSPIPQFVIDRNHRVIHWNKAIEEYSGIQAKEIIGTNQQWRAFYHKERPCMADLLIDGETDKIPQWYEGKYTKSKFIDGRFDATDFFPHMGRSGTWLYFTAAPIRDSKGSVIGAVETLEDVTERKRAEEALRDANKKLNLLSSITRHDINNQLLTINGFLELLQSEVRNPALAEYFTRITNAIARITSMIQFTKTYECIGVQAPVWQDARTLVETAAQESHLGSVGLADTLPAGTEMFADPLVVKVFSNLLENAVRYGERITTIRFSGEEYGGDYRIICEDDGVGIPADQKEKIFLRGFGKNTGLGLFLAREILAITGITIKETGEPGKGARFEITIPNEGWRTSDVGRKGG